MRILKHINIGTLSRFKLLLFSKHQILKVKVQLIKRHTADWNVNSVHSNNVSQVA